MESAPTPPHMQTLFSSPIGYWVHNLSPFLIEFPDGFPLDGIRWYGLSYIAAFVAAAFILMIYRKRNRSPLQRGEEIDLLTYLLVGVIVGGRMGHVFLYNWYDFTQNPAVLFQVWKGGMASHGGIIGVALALLFFSWRRQTPFLQLTDVIVSIAPLGLFFGRIANFINGELWGRTTEVYWAVIFPGSPANSITGEIEPRHPSQLYQAFGEGLLLFLWLQLRFWKNPQLRPGQISGEFLIGYGLLRFITEFFREPDASLIIGISRGQFYSLPLLVIGVVLLLWVHRKK